VSMDEIEPVREANTPSEMRAEIIRLSRYNYLVRAAMDSADYTGLSAEDRYTLLAYHALAALARHQKVLHEHVLTTPSRHLVMPTSMSDTEQAERLERERLQRESLTKQLHGRKPPKFEAADYGAPCFDEDKP